MPCRDNIGIEIVQGTICKDRSRARVSIGYPETIPVGRLSHIYVKVEWGQAEAGRVLQLEFRRRAESTGGDDIVFDGPDGEHSRSLDGDAERLLAIFAKSARVGEELNTHLNIKLDDDEYGVDPPIEIVPVDPQPEPSGEDAAAILEREVAIALRIERPTEAAEQGIWDRYSAIHEDARNFAEALESAEIGQAGVPLLPREELERMTFSPPGDPEGAVILPPSLVEIEPDQRDFDRAEIAAHLRSHRDPDALANAKARGRNNAFDRFQGHWRGYWRQKQDYLCADYFNEFQDHDWGETRRLADDSSLWLQRVLLGPDSRPYALGAPVDCTAMEPGRDFDTPALNAIDIETGLIAGAVGVKPEADDDGVQSRRPHIGFYVDHGKLLWVAEEGREGERVTYSVFYEISQGEDDQPLEEQRYTIMGFQFQWDRSQRQIQGELETKAGQYVKILSEVQQQLERDFRERRLQQGHLDDMRYRRRLEFSHPDVIQAFLDHPDNAARHDYLERLLAFARQQEALRTAPLGERESITFIMGDPDPDPDDPDAHADPFYIAAGRYFELNPSTHVQPMDGRSLREVRDHLQNHPPQTPAPVEQRRWGKVSVVVHANEWGNMTIPVVPGGDAVSEDSLAEALAAGDFDPLPDELFDVRTRFYIRGCNIGRNQSFIDNFSVALGQSDADDIQRPQVFAPKSLQVFRFWTFNDDVFTVEQYLEQSWYVVYPPNGGKTREQLRDLFIAKHGEEVDWYDALGRTEERYLGDLYHQEETDPDDRITLTFRVQFADAADMPVLDTVPQQEQWVNAQDFIEEWVNGLGLEMDDLRWRAENRVADLITAATGTGNYVTVKRAITAELEERFTVETGFQADLDRRVLPPELWVAFAAHDNRLGREAFVTIHWVGHLWLITDPENRRTYALRRDPDHIQVLLEGPRPAPPDPLFTIPAAANTRNSLNIFIVPAALRNAFPAGIPLSGNVLVMLGRAHWRWVLFDQDNARIYAVSRVGGTLNIYEQPQAAHPPITDEQFFGMHIPAKPPEQVWGGNVAP